MITSKKNFDFLVIGGGIIGLSIARELKKQSPSAKIAILEKENDVALHASGRNSGVLHAGFYYTADSFKARFCRDGNREMQAFCNEKGLALNACGKLVVATNEEELKGLEELKKRADKNGVELLWMDEGEVDSMDPNAKTHKRALYSPNTATVDPREVCNALKEELIEGGVQVFLNTTFKAYRDSVVITSNGSFETDFVINVAGLYADKIAEQFGFSRDHVLIPFKGLYLKRPLDGAPIKTNIYPVPNLKNPFLGVHFTVTVDGSVKIGPTAIPAFWRENYKGFSRFNFGEFFETLYYEGKLFFSNAFGFRDLAFEEMKKYWKSNLFKFARRMVKELKEDEFNQWTEPGIRAQLVNKKSLEIVQDFVFEGDEKSLHVLNAISPAFTCAFPIAKHIVRQTELKR
ncbi:L-2-hydroxyglutarate oxidase [Bdellovibrionota bacterium]